MSAANFPPRRIVCLTAETVETLYLLGAEERIVGITGFATRPLRARREKPKIGAFTTADTERIAALSPDLVLTFSDLQAEITADLVKRGIEVHAFNQRSITGIRAMIATLGALVGASAAAETLLVKLALCEDEALRRARHLARRPRVYFEEWDDPPIAGIGWVSEIVALAGGIDVFAERAQRGGAKDRIVSPDEIIAAAPDIVIASWCGKAFDAKSFAARPGFAALPAVAKGELHEIAAPLILAPGPAVLTDGLAAIQAIIEAWARRDYDGGSGTT